MYPQSLTAVDAGSSAAKVVRVRILGRAEVLVSRDELFRMPERGADACGRIYLLAFCTGARAEHGQDLATLLQPGECTLVEGGACVHRSSFVGASCLLVQFTQAALDAIADEANATRITSLAPIGTALQDDCIAAIGAAMMSDLQALTPSSRLFLNSLTLALLTHVAIRYGGLEPLERVRKGGLAPWQARRAQEQMMARLDTDVELSAVARECGLSISHFSRAFRNTVGEPPHTWLIKRRLDAAKEMMASGDLALATVALSCGFADQSHFTRAFTRDVGTSPGLWRRCLSR